MLRVLLTAGAVATVATLGPFGSRPASAGGSAPWCAVVDIGGEMASYCHFWSVEACVPHVLAGNRGACSPNPDFRGPVERSYRRYGKHRRWR